MATGGYFTVYSVNDQTLLAVVAEDGLNVARLHLEFRGLAARVDELVRSSASTLTAMRPRL